MVQVIETGGNLAGRIGKGFGKGLAEQLPKEIERYRLSSGLEKLGKQDLSGQNQLQMLSKIYSIPGMTPEIANLAQQQIAKQNFLNRKIGNQQSSALPQGQLPVNPAPQQIPQKSSVSESGFASPQKISEMKKGYLQEPSFADTKTLADEYLLQGLTQDPNQAMQLAKQELGQNRIAQQQKNQALRTNLDERMKLSLQGGGLGHYKDVVGDIQKRLVDQGEYMVNNLGMTPEQAAEKLDGIALELGKTSNSLKDTGSFWNMFRPSSRKTTDLKNQKKEFEKYGFGEEFDDMVTGQMGITPLQTAHILDPLKNKTIQDEIGKSKKFFGKLDKKMNDKTLEKIISAIKPDDNLFSIEYLLRERGYDVNQFKRKVQDMEADKKTALTPQQKRQQNRTVDQSILGDILYQIF